MRLRSVDTIAIERRPGSAHARAVLVSGPAIQSDPGVKIACARLHRLALRHPYRVRVGDPAAQAGFAFGSSFLSTVNFRLNCSNGSAMAVNRGTSPAGGFASRE
jgi:hypothetical protein